VFAKGEIIGEKFRVERVLGQGGMGVVLIALHVELDQRVAIKVLNEKITSDAAAVERFVREARAAAKLRSEHVCRVSDVGRLDDGSPYIVMELLSGSDLAAVVANGPLPVPTAIDYVLQACEALAEAHALGIVHRDLKPANLFLTRRLDGSPLVKVLDFGIAKAPAVEQLALTRTDTMMGSPGYMSPEQLRSARDVDARTDVWALGVILYQLMSGRVPFPATTLTELAVMIAMDPPQPLEVAPALRAVVFRCLEKAPDDRYPDIGELAAALVPFGDSTAAAKAGVIAKVVRPRASLDATVAVQAGALAATVASIAPARESRQVETTLQGATGVATAMSTVPPRTGLKVFGALAALAILAFATIVVVKLTSRPRVIMASAPSTESTAEPLPTSRAIVVDAAEVVTDPVPPVVAPPPRPTNSDRATTKARKSASVKPAIDGEQPPPPAIAQLELDATDAMLEGRWNKALSLSKKILAIDPEHQRALYWAVSASCAIPDAEEARRYAPKLSAEARAKLQRYVCDRNSVVLARE